jgi:hypothetical protein
VKGMPAAWGNDTMQGLGIRDKGLEGGIRG